MASNLTTHLFQFLQTEHKIPATTLESLLDDCNQVPNLVPVALWQSGIVSTEQLDTIFDWLELTY
ncbi:DUF2949 domain-containing protein [Leptolyngbya cf. ectocarpi LEGE 11479]|uniref:DUF2949 domain-containing protein n=1 Tax=Leptolyngbya cf. ectocarpi LEGE 11479 TaxID=1828722 RepID=A0A928ZUJ2_LEPEC|nr:DUF2949 domain-containing protein [Leptolyngbya ectocarpi]MBE9067722.1 DUF2949 domain-containing protein [Leptolyngbya cf. ectocarpi LEGE 11479]